MERSVAKRETLDASHLGWVCDKTVFLVYLSLSILHASLFSLSLSLSLSLSFFLYSHSVYYTLFYSIPIVYSTVLLLPPTCPIGKSPIQPDDSASC